LHEAWISNSTRHDEELRRNTRTAVDQDLHAFHSFPPDSLRIDALAT
jgi:hypothetical protein